MAKFIIEKSPSLNGTVKISGSKNAALPILAASILTSEKCKICDIPLLNDVSIMMEIIKELGASVECNEEKEEIVICSKNISKFEASYDLATQMRASFLIMGALLARFGKANVPLPGGCAIGTRPVDLHLKGFLALGAEVIQEHGTIFAKADKLKGANIYLDFPSVGATENIIMAACLAEGISTIENAAVEPEIVDLANFLNSMGADIRGAGTDTIKINGVKSLRGTEHTIIPDRIEAGTFMVGAAISKGDVIIENVVIDHLKPMIAKLKEANVFCEEFDTSIRICAKEKIKGVDIKTLPYPGFPTDMQAQFMSLLCVAEGTSIVNETIFENRFMHAGELNRMGAEIKVESHSAIIEGVDRLMGAKVKATDLRAGAALILSALTAEGTTEIGDIYHIERGYYKIENKLKKLGANIKKVEEE